MNRKHILPASMLIAAAMITAACTLEDSAKSSFSDLCRESKGSVAESGNCVCGNTECSKGVVCDEIEQMLVCAGAGISCQDGESKCENDEESSRGTAYTCKAGEWIEQNTCTTSCKPDIRECGECLDGTSECTETEDKTIYRKCISGKWESMDCAYSCDGNVCGECQNDATTCVGEPKNDNKDTEFKCSKGKWDTGTVCEESSCNHKTQKCGSCKDGESRCENDQMKICSNGEWVNTGSPCNCKDGEMQCVNEVGEDNQNHGVMQKCVDNQWVTSEVCADNVLCKDNTKCATECDDDMKTCSPDGKAIVSCKDGEWDNVQPENCDGTKMCTIGENGPECSDSTTECASGQKKCVLKNGTNTIYECSAENKWNTTGTTCDAGCDVSAHYDSKPECYECANGDTECKDGKITTCVDHKWDVDHSEPCTNGQCDQNGKTCKVDCQNGDTTCSNGQLSICSNGAWGPGNACDNNASCKDNHSCGVCKDGDINYNKDGLSPTVLKDQKLGDMYDFLKIGVPCEKGAWNTDKLSYCWYDKKAGIDECQAFEPQVVNTTQKTSVVDVTKSGDDSYTIKEIRTIHAEAKLVVYGTYKFGKVEYKINNTIHSKENVDCALVKFRVLNTSTPGNVDTEYGWVLAENLERLTMLDEYLASAKGTLATTDSRNNTFRYPILISKTDSYHIILGSITGKGYMMPYYGGYTIPNEYYPGLLQVVSGKDYKNYWEVFYEQQICYLVEFTAEKQ